MSFRLVPKLVICNGVMALIILRNLVASRVHCVKVVEDIPKLSATEV